MHILITGTAGFIGSFLAEALAKRGHQIYGIDSINDYYDVNLKKNTSGKRRDSCSLLRQGGNFGHPAQLPIPANGPERPKRAGHYLSKPPL